MKTGILFITLTMFMMSDIYSQCTDCGGATSPGTNASAIGTYTHAIGHSSFASGFGSEATAFYTTALGFYSFATDVKAIAIGSAVKSNRDRSIVIGSGSYSAGKYLENNFDRSLIIGFNSTRPTLFVSESPYTPSYDKTGRVAIGNVNLAVPQAKLHIRADDGEVAAVLIEPNSWAGSAQAHLFLGNKFNGITASRDSGLIFWSQRNYVFGNDGFVGINTFAPQYNLHVNGSTFTEGFRLYDDKLPPKQGYVLVSVDELGNAFWTDPNDYSLWKPHENGQDIYRLTGNVGIGIIETGEYRLAVLGKIHATEVMVEHEVDWPDYVLKDGYILPGLEEVETFIKENNHLPDIPSANEVKENGIALGKMNGLLLRKIEELTLYTIEQQKLIVEQQKQMEKMESRLSELEK